MGRSARRWPRCPAPPGAAGQGAGLRGGGARRQPGGHVHGLPGRPAGPAGGERRPARRAGAAGGAPALLLSGFFLPLMGIFGLGLGALVRRSGAAVAAYFGSLVVPDLLLALLGDLWRFGPITILANSISAADVQPEFLHPSQGLTVMVGTRRRPWPPAPTSSPAGTSDRVERRAARMTG